MKFLRFILTALITAALCGPLFYLFGLIYFQSSFSLHQSYLIILSFILMGLTIVLPAYIILYFLTLEKATRLLIFGGIQIFIILGYGLYYAWKFEMTTLTLIAFLPISFVLAYRLIKD